MKCEQQNRLDSEDTPVIETAPVLLMLNSNMKAKQSEKIKSQLIPDVLKYLGILAECLFSSHSFIVNLKMEVFFQLMSLTILDEYNLWNGSADSGDMEETEDVNSHCSLNAEWSFNSVIAKTKLTDLLIHEVRGDWSPSTFFLHTFMLFSCMPLHFLVASTILSVTSSCSWKNALIKVMVSYEWNQRVYWNDFGY